MLSSLRLAVVVTIALSVSGGAHSDPRSEAMHSSSPEANKALVLRFYEEVWNQGHIGFAQEVFAENYVRHDLRPTQAQPGPAGQAKIASDFRRAFPDLRFNVDLVLAEADLVAARWTAKGTNLGSVGSVSGNWEGRNVLRCEHFPLRERKGRRDLESSG